MLDTTPPPFGDITRRWATLEEADRDRQIARLVGDVCSGDPVHVDRPALDGGRCYQQLAAAALAGDPIALGWLGTSHRPLLITRGRPLLEDDPAEWGSYCLWLLHTALERLPACDPRWLRRHVAQRLTSRLSLEVSLYLGRRDRERAAEQDDLAASAHAMIEEWDPPLDLSIDLGRLLDGLDEATREGLWALAYGRPLTEVAERHGLSHAALRQRVTRARLRLQPQLAHYRREAA